MTAVPTLTYRNSRDKRINPMSPSGSLDNLESIARQVRLPGGVPHQLVGEPYTVPGEGRHYRIRCGGTLTARHGAVLTTAEVGCARCTGKVPPDERAKEMVEAILAVLA